MIIKVKLVLTFPPAIEQPSAILIGFPGISHAQFIVAPEHAEVVHSKSVCQQVCKKHLLQETLVCLFCSKELSW